MKIAFVIEHFISSRGGGESYAATLSREVVVDGHELHVFAGSFEYPGCEVRFHKMPLRKHPRFYREASFDVAVTCALEKEKFDLILSFSRTTRLDVSRPGGGCHQAWMRKGLLSFSSGAQRLMRKNVQLVSPRVAILKNLERNCYRNAKKIIAVSTMVKDDIIEFYPEVADKIEIVHNGLDTARFSPKNRKLFRDEMRQELGLGDEIAIVFTANNFRLKGLEPLIKALGLIESETVLVVVGKGRCKPYETLAKQVNTKIIFAGEVKQTERVYAACDIAAHPTFYDPFSNVTLEAMASGIPIVTTKMNGASEILTNGENGFIVDNPADYKSLADCFRKLLEPEKRKEMGARGRLIAESFTTKENARKILGLYKNS